MSDFNDDAPLDVADLPGSNGSKPSGQPHTQVDLLGLMSGGATGSPLDKLIEGSDQFMEWSARGNRSAKERVAEVYLIAETAALKSEHFPVRARMMKGIHKQEALRSLMAVARPQLNKYEFWIVVVGMAAILVILFLITTMVSE